LSATTGGGRPKSNVGVPFQNISYAASVTKQLVDGVDTGVGRAQYGLAALKWISAHQAFGMKQFFASATALNAAGNLRGLVSSRNWRHVYELSVSYSKSLASVAEKVNIAKVAAADFAAWASYISGWATEIDREINSDTPLNIKGENLLFYATTALVTTITGTAHGITDGIIDAVEKSCQYAPLVGIKSGPGSTECSNYADIARASVAVYYRNIDGAVQPDAIRKTFENAEAPLIDALMGTADRQWTIIRRPFK
jgi:hypothetical protein